MPTNGPIDVTAMSPGSLARALIAGIDHHALDWGHEAAVRFLIAQGSWLRRDALRVHVGAETATTGMPYAWIRWARLAAQTDQAPASSGERAVLRLACHLAGELPDQPGNDWAFSEILSRLDITTALLASRAVAMASLGPDAVGPLT